MKLVHTVITGVLLYAFGAFVFGVRGEEVALLTRSEFGRLPEARFVFDFLSEMKLLHSINDSKRLWKYIDPTADRKKEGHEGDAAIRTILVKEIIAIDQSLSGDLVTAVVQTNENVVEILTFSFVETGGSVAIKLPEESDPFSPYRTPWHIRIKLSAQALKLDQ